MLRKVKFIVYGEPQGKGRPRFRAMYSQAANRAFVNVRTPEKTVQYENLIRLEYGIQTKDFRFEDEAMLDMRILAFYPIPKRTTDKKRKEMLGGMIRQTKKPDIDNVIKVVADSLNQIAYKDDKQIVDSQCRKFFSEKPRIEVTIQKIEPKTMEG